MIGSRAHPHHSRLLFTTPPSSSDCFQAWIDNFNTCTAATGGMTIPTEPTNENAPDRAEICLQPACQKLFTVFRSLIDTKCPGALNEVKLYPNGMYTTTFCPPISNPIPPPTTTAPPTTTPPPTTTAPPTTTQPPTTTAPPTTTPPPTTTRPPTTSPPTTEPPPPSTTSTPTPTTSEPTSTPSVTAPLATSTPEARESETPTTIPPRSSSASSTSGSSGQASPVTSIVPSPGLPVSSITSAPIATTDPATAISASKSSSSTTTIAAAGGGGFVVLVALVIIFFVLRHKRRTSPRQDIESEFGKDAEAGYAGSEYTNFSNAPTEDTYTQSGVLDGGRELSKKRIPFRALRLGQVVSQGGFGEVIKGTYKNQVVAVKRLLAARRSHQDNIDSFSAEIKLTATLEHDCLVRFIGYAWNVPANLCMVSEFMHGGDLHTLMVKYADESHTNGHDDAKLRILEHVACALQYLHTRNPPVVHRDLKSRNILLTSQGDAKVIDFGISCERQDYTMTAGVGTKLWMAPEVMLGERYDEKADVFSFGVILSELDTHALPYDNAREEASNKKLNDVKLTQLISQGKIHPRFTNLAHPAIVTLAKACLQLIPSTRPSASELVSLIVRIRHREITSTRSRTRGRTNTDPGTGTAASRTMSHDSVLSFESHATTQSAGGRG